MWSSRNPNIVLGATCSCYRDTEKIGTPIIRRNTPNQTEQKITLLDTYEIGKPNYKTRNIYSELFLKNNPGLQQAGKPTEKVYDIQPEEAAILNKTKIVELTYEK